MLFPLLLLLMLLYSLALMGLRVRQLAPSFEQAAFHVCEYELSKFGSESATHIRVAGTTALNAMEPIRDVIERP